MALVTPCPNCGRVELEEPGYPCSVCGSPGTEAEPEAFARLFRPGALIADLTAADLEELAATVDRVRQQHGSRPPVVLELTRPEADLLAAVLDFGGIENDNLDNGARDGCREIAGRIEQQLNGPAWNG